MRARGLLVAALVVASMAAAMGWVYAVRIAPRWLQVVRLRVQLPNLPAEWRGVRVAHLSDLHAGNPAVPLSLLFRARHAVLAFEPEIIAITGDFFHQGVHVPVDGLFGDWPAGARVFGVLGNHDYRSGGEDLDWLLRALRADGVRVLHDEAVRFQLRGREAWIVGVNDPYTWHANQEEAFEDLPEDADALLYLAHAASVVRSLPVGRARLLLTGHTHGGQIRLLPSGRVPFLKLIRDLLDEPPRDDPDLYHGIHWVRGAVVVVSNGVGMSQFPARVRTRPQVVLIELDELAEDGAPCDDVRRFVEECDPEPWLWRWLS
jgi:predicted MPP superfamily phosphohydrolase